MRNYILNCINTEDYQVEACTDFDKLMFLYKTFESEYLYPQNLQKYGSKRNCFESWLRCLPSCLDIVFDYCDIIEKGEELKLDRHEGILCENWFKILTDEYFKLFNYYNIQSLHKAKFKKGDSVFWSHLPNEPFKIKSVFYDCGIRYSLISSDGIEYGGRIFESELKGAE